MSVNMGQRVVVVYLKILHLWEALLNDDCDINVPDSELKFPDCNTATPVVIITDEPTSKARQVGK